MPIPSVTVEMYFPGLGWRDVSDVCSIESSLEITEAIENPTETNLFVAPDVSLRLMQDGSGLFTFSMFANLLPESTDFLVRVKRETVTVFYGFVLPNTVQFDDTERWCSFTAIGLAGKLARTAAEDLPLLKRIVDPGWRVYQAGGEERSGTVVISNVTGARLSCEIMAGDTVTVETPGGQKDELTVTGVLPTTETSPYTYFELSVTGLKQAYEVGSVVTLITPFRRNISVKELIDRLLIGSGLNPTTSATFLAAPLAGASAPFATQPNLDFLLQTGATIAPIGISTHVTPYVSDDPPGSFPIVGTVDSVYAQQNPPTGTWTAYAHIGHGVTPVDWRPRGSGKWLQYGKRYQRTLLRAGAPTPSVYGAIYSFWAYDYSSIGRPVTFRRYRLEIEVDNFDTQGATYQWETRLFVEESSDGWQWTTVSGPFVSANGSTSVNLHEEVPLTCGIDLLRVLTFTRVIFTEPNETVDPCGYYVSMMAAAGGAPTRNIVPTWDGLRGNVFAHASDRVVIARRDTGRTDVPTLFILRADGVDITVQSASAIPADFQPLTLRYNEGDGFWYALSASRAGGVKLLSFSTSALTTRAGWDPPALLPPSNSLGGRVDMTVINGPTGTTWPMMAIVGNTLWWISRSASGWIEYADVEGLSCGEAIAQLCTLLDAYAYVTSDLSAWVKARGTGSGRTIATGTSATSTRIDDEGCLSLRRASVWYKSYRYVTVKNERDETIVGTAGSVAFRDSEQALELVSRFVSTQSFATALAQNLLSYLGRALAVVDVEHELDSRRYEIGRTFTASINGVVKTFQIIETTLRPVAGTVRVQGVEM